MGTFCFCFCFCFFTRFLEQVLLVLILSIRIRRQFQLIALGLLLLLLALFPTRQQLLLCQRRVGSRNKAPLPLTHGFAKLLGIVIPPNMNPPSNLHWLTFLQLLRHLGMHPLSKPYVGRDRKSLSIFETIFDVDDAFDSNWVDVQWSPVGDATISGLPGRDIYAYDGDGPSHHEIFGQTKKGKYVGFVTRVEESPVRGSRIYVTGGDGLGGYATPFFGGTEPRLRPIWEGRSS